MSVLSTLASFNWKRHGNTAFKVLFQPKILGLIGLLGFVFYGIAWDTVLRPSLETLKQRDDLINKEREALSKKEAGKQHYETLAKELHDLQIDMIPIAPGDSSTVLAVSQAASLLTLAKGSDRNKRGWPVLPAPHDRRDNVSLTPIGSSTVNLQEQQATDANGAAPGSPPTPGATDNKSPTAPVSTVERFDYTLKATGTYPALMDLLNELVTERTLVKINRVQISLALPSPSGQSAVMTPPPQPDAKEYPDYPVKLDLVLTLSLFLYASDAPPSPPKS